MVLDLVSLCLSLFMSPSFEWSKKPRKCIEPMRDEIYPTSPTNCGMGKGRPKI